TVCSLSSADHRPRGGDDLVVAHKSLTAYIANVGFRSFAAFQVKSKLPIRSARLNLSHYI
ncbi:hypothetical protein, partial [Alteromonas sp. LOR]|uniref:hypothetical protein n=1 Tax=Alteromonas sp. (strain LOR) TaxID=1537994 RepID=UPI001F1B977B